MVVPRKGSKHEQTPGTSTQNVPATRSSDDRHDLVVTLSGATHAVLEIARLDKTGGRHPLSDEELMEFAGHEQVDEATRWLLEAFEAGLVEGLGVEDDEDDFDDDAVLSRLLLSRSAEQGVLRLDLRRAIVRRLVLRRLLRSRLAHVPTAPEQRRKPIGDEVRNGSGSGH
jgi:hypothetical protein